MRTKCEIPQRITEEFLREWVRPRVSEKRFQHVIGVVAEARVLADEFRCDRERAAVAAWLHDACKEVQGSRLVSMAEEFGLKLDPIERRQGHILHGPVAAEVVQRELGITDVEVLDAIREHTLGAVPMTTLSQIIYLADCLEPGRPADFREPIRAALRTGSGPEAENPERSKKSGQGKKAKGERKDEKRGKTENETGRRDGAVIQPEDDGARLAAALVTAIDLGLGYLIESGKPIHPRTVSVRNYYLDRMHGRISD